MKIPFSILAASALAGCVTAPRLTAPPAASTAVTQARLDQLGEKLQEQGISDQKVDDLLASAKSRAQQLSEVLDQLDRETQAAALNKKP